VKQRKDAFTRHGRVASLRRPTTGGNGDRLQRDQRLPILTREKQISGIVALDDLASRTVGAWQPTVCWIPKKVGAVSQTSQRARAPGEAEVGRGFRKVSCLCAWLSLVELPKLFAWSRATLYFSEGEDIHSFVFVARRASFN